METKNLLNKKITQWLLLVAMLVGCSASAWAGQLDWYKVYYLRGSFNSWTKSDSNWKLTSVDGNQYKATFYIDGASSNYEFKIYCSSWDCDYCNSGFWFTSSNTTAKNVNAGSGNNMQIQCIKTSSNVRIKLDVELWCSYDNDSKLTITQTAVPILKGDWDGWTQHDISSSVTINMSSTGSKEFGISSASGSFYKSASITRSNCSSVALSESGNNAKLDVDIIGNYKFTWDDTNHKVSVTYPTCPTPTCSISSGASTVKAGTEQTYQATTGGGTGASVSTVTWTTPTNWSIKSGYNKNSNPIVYVVQSTAGSATVKCTVTNSCGNTKEATKSVTVYKLPTVTTTAATNIKNTSATLGGSYSEGSTPSAVGIKWVSGEGVTPGAKVSATVKTPYSVNVSDLSPNSTYVYKAYATVNGEDAEGSEQSFTTAPSTIYIHGPLKGDDVDCWNNDQYTAMNNDGNNNFVYVFNNPSCNNCSGNGEFVLTKVNANEQIISPDNCTGRMTGCEKSTRDGNNFKTTLTYSNADKLTLTVTWNSIDNYTVSLAKTETNQPNKLYIKGPFVTGGWGGYDNEATVSDNKYIFEFTADGSNDEFCLSTNTDDRGKIHYITSVGTQGGWAFVDGAGSNFKASSELKGKKVKITVTWLGSSTFSMDVEANECTKPTLSISQYSGSRTDRITSVKARMNPKGDCTVTEFGVKRYTDSACTQNETTVTGDASSTAEQEIKFEGCGSNTQYWFKAYAITEESGTVWSDNVITDYTRVSLPQQSAINITSTTATLVGLITKGGNYVSNVYKAWFTYGPTTGKENKSDDIMSQAVSAEFTANISGLQPNTTYRYFVNATSKEGDSNSTSNREMNTFTTNNVHSDIVLADQSVCVGANITLTPTCATATNGFTYESKNTSVATVDANGVVHGVAAGSAIITVTTKEVPGYDVKTKDITVTVNAAAFTIVVSPDSPLAYQVVTLSASNGKSTTWTKASSDAYFVGADGLVISGNEATAESIKLKAKSGATSTVYTISATQSDGTCAYNTREITVSADTENCSGN